MFLPVEAAVFIDDKDRVLKAETKLPVVLNRLFIPSHVAIDFVIVDAVVKPKDVEKPVPLFAGDDSPVHAVTFTETTFGHTPLGVPMAPGDVVELTVRCISKMAPGIRRDFWAVFDVSTPKR